MPQQRSMLSRSGCQTRNQAFQNGRQTCHIFVWQNPTDHSWRTRQARAKLCHCCRKRMPYLLFDRRVHRERVGRGQDEYVAGGFAVAFSVPEGLCGCAMLVKNEKITSDTHGRGWRKVYTSSGQQLLSTFSFHFTRDGEEQRANEMFECQNLLRHSRLDGKPLFHLAHWS